MPQLVMLYGKQKINKIDRKEGLWKKSQRKGKEHSVVKQLLTTTIGS